MLLRPSLSFPSITEGTTNEQDVRPASSMSDLLCIGKGPFAGRACSSVVPNSNRRVFYSVDARVGSTRGEFFEHDDSTSRERAGTPGRFRHDGKRPNGASLVESPTTIGRGGREGSERKRNCIIQVDVVDDPACPRRPSGDTQVHPGTVMVSRLCERAKNLALCPHTGPFLPS